MPMTCQEFVFLSGKELGMREWRKDKECLVHWVGIRMDFQKKSYDLVQWKLEYPGKNHRMQSQE